LVNISDPTSFSIESLFVFPLETREFVLSALKHLLSPKLSLNTYIKNLQVLAPAGKGLSKVAAEDIKKQAQSLKQKGVTLYVIDRLERLEKAKMNISINPIGDFQNVVLVAKGDLLKLNEAKLKLQAQLSVKKSPKLVNQNINQSIESFGKYQGRSAGANMCGLTSIAASLEQAEPNVKIILRVLLYDVYKKASSTCKKKLDSIMLKEDKSNYEQFYTTADLLDILRKFLHVTEAGIYTNESGKKNPISIFTTAAEHVGTNFSRERLDIQKSLVDRIKSVKMDIVTGRYEFLNLQKQFDALLRIKTLLKNGNGFTIGTSLTKSGHFLDLEDVVLDIAGKPIGILVNNPFGWFDTTFKRHYPVNSFILPTNFGAYQFHSIKEMFEYRIGKTIVQISKIGI
jgi:hypothetical protein